MEVLESFKRMKKKQLLSSKNVPEKFPKKKLLRTKLKKNKNSTKLIKNKNNAKSSKFILDRDGSISEHKTLSKYKVSKRSAKDVLGHDSLLEKERELATDLFGGDAELPFNITGEISGNDPPTAQVSTESPLEEVPQIIPDDPYDVHHQVTKPSRKPVWVDEDDENIKVKDVVTSHMKKTQGKRGITESSEQKYELTLQRMFKHVFSSTPEWAELDHKVKKESDDEDEMIRSTANYLSEEPSVSLPKTRLEFKQLHSLNHTSHSEGAIIKAVEFNPAFQVGLVAGSSNNKFGAATLFQVDGEYNHKIQSVKFPQYPIKCAKFLKGGRRYIIGSNLSGYFYVYDMEAARETKIPIVKSKGHHYIKNFYVSPDGKLIVLLMTKRLLRIFDAHALSLIETLHSPEEIEAVAFNNDGSRMYTHGSGGDVLVWDMTSRLCIHKFYDDGCVDGTSITVSPNNRYLACGSSSGIVNVYEMASISNRTPSPVKVLDKLVTKVTDLTFNPSSEILAMASAYMDKAAKLVHLPSLTCFTNFPPFENNLHKVQVLNFSPKSGFLAAGNNRGNALLYRLKHFSSY